MSGSFPGEDPKRLMRKRQRSNPKVSCGSCRMFDGLAWCRHWNFHTDAISPICGDYRPLSGDVPALKQRP